MTVNKKSSFSYTKRDPESIKHRAVSGGFSGEGYLKSEFKVLKMEDRIFNLRILPPTWKDANHYGKDVWIHYLKVGADNNTYLCPNKMFNEPCPMCEERLLAEKEGDLVSVGKLKPSRRILMWVIDRKDEKVGPQIFSCPPTLDTNFCKLSVNSRTNEVLCIDDPDEGYDIEFERIAAKGKDGFPNYIAPNVDRRSSPLGSEEDAAKWLEFVVSFPIPSIWITYSYDHLKKSFEGKLKKEPEEENVEEITEESKSLKTEIKQEVKEVKEVKQEAKPIVKETKLVSKEKKLSILSSIKTKDAIDNLSRVDSEEVCAELGFDNEAISSASDADLKEAIFTELESKLIKEEPLKDEKISKLKDKLKSLRNNG